MKKRGKALKKIVKKSGIIAVFCVAILVLSGIPQDLFSMRAQATPSFPENGNGYTIPTGYEPWYYYIDGLVNAFNGNLYFTQGDFSVGSIGLDQLQHQIIEFREPVDYIKKINILRAYNSLLNDTDGPFGFGWTHNYNIYLVENVSGDVILYEGDGTIHLFTKDGAGFEITAAMIMARLVDLEDRVGLRIVPFIQTEYRVNKDFRERAEDIARKYKL